MKYEGLKKEVLFLVIQERREGEIRSGVGSLIMEGIIISKIIDGCQVCLVGSHFSLCWLPL